jgi:hypothetical protein
LSRAGLRRWDVAWNASLPVDAAALTAAVKCNSTWQTWSDSPGTPSAESHPMNCINWYEANAFCIWDGGRLPSEAEWNYTAAGGSQQRQYPWGATAPDLYVRELLWGGGRHGLLRIAGNRLDERGRLGVAEGRRGLGPIGLGGKRYRVDPRRVCEPLHEPVQQLLPSHYRRWPGGPRRELSNSEGGRVARFD